MTKSQALPYTYIPPGRRKIVGGQGALDRLVELVDQHEVRRALIVTSPSMVKEGNMLDEVRSHLGDRLVGMFDEVERHSPIEVVHRALHLARTQDADAVVSLGGGSSVDTAKGIVWYIDEEAEEPPLVHVSIPSTLSGAEYTTDAGITLAEGKRVHRHDRIIPRVVILDPRVLATAPLDLLRMSLLNALAHCLEGLISIGSSPMTDAAYLHSIRLLHSASGKLDQEEGRWEAQAGAALAALHQVPVGLAHALAHVIGGRYRAPHGATHAIVGPAVMRFNIPVAAAKQVAIAEAVGVNLDGLSAEEGAWKAVIAVRQWAADLGIPPGLKDLGVPEDGIEVIAEEVPHDPSFATNPRELNDREDWKSVVEWAWSGEIPPP